MLSFKKIADFLKKVGSRDGGGGGSGTATAGNPSLQPAREGLSEATSGTGEGVSASGTFTSAAEGNLSSSAILHGLPPNADTQAVLIHVQHVVQRRMRDLEESGQKQQLQSRGEKGSTSSAAPPDQQHRKPARSVSRPATPFVDSTSSHLDSMSNIALEQPMLSRAAVRTDEVHSMGASPLNNLPASLADSCPTMGQRLRASTPDWVNTPVATSHPTSIGVVETAKQRDVLAELQRKRTEMIDALDVCLQEVPDVAAAPKLSGKPPALEALFESRPAAAASHDTTPKCGEGPAARSFANSPADSAATEGGDTSSTGFTTAATSYIATPANDTALDSGCSRSNIFPEESQQPTILSADPLTTTSTAAAVEATVSRAAVTATTPVSAPFTVREWRTLLLQIVNVLAEIDRGIYAEQCNRAERHTREVAAVYAESGAAIALANSLSTFHPIADTGDVAEKDRECGSPRTTQQQVVVPMLTPDRRSTTLLPTADAPLGTRPVHTGGLDEKRERALTAETHRLVEDVLSTACAIATWVTLRFILRQHIAWMDGKDARADKNKAIPAQAQVAGTSSEQRGAHTVADETAALNGSAVPVTSASPASGESVAPLQKPSSLPPISATPRSAAQPRGTIEVEWHIVVREIRQLLNLTEEGMSECILCASFLRDDGRELSLCMVQEPKPRSYHTQLTARRLGIKTQASSVPQSSSLPVPQVALRRQSSVMVGNDSAGKGPSTSPAATRSSSPELLPVRAPTPGGGVAAPLALSTADTTPRPQNQLDDDEMVLDDILASLEHSYEEAVSKTWSAYLQESVHHKGERAANNLVSVPPSTTSAAQRPLRDETHLPLPHPSSHDAAKSQERRGQGQPSAEGLGGHVAADGGATEPSPAPISFSIDDPFAFCELATAFFFCSNNWAVEQRVHLFSTLHNYMDTYAEKERDSHAVAPTNVQGPTTSPLANGMDAIGTPRPPQVFLGMAPSLFGPVASVPNTEPATLEQQQQQQLEQRADKITKLEETQASLSSVASSLKPPIAGGGDTNNNTVEVGTCATEGGLPLLLKVTSVDGTGEDRVACGPEMLAAASAFSMVDGQGSASGATMARMTQLPVIQRYMLERIINMAWSATLHKRVTHCLTARPPKLDTASTCADEERTAAAAFNDFRARQRALSSLIHARLAAGKSQEALLTAQRHFKKERKEWTSRSQSIFTAIWYLQSMVQLVQAQAACRSFGAVVETVQFVLPQAALCEQMLAILAPPPRGGFIVRFGDSRTKLLQARVYLLKEIWHAHASFANRAKAGLYFTEYVAALSLTRRRVRESELFEAYMERGSQQLQNSEYAEAVTLFKSAVDLAKRVLAKTNIPKGPGTIITTAAGTTSSMLTSSIPASPLHSNVAVPIHSATSVQHQQPRFHKNLHLRVAGSGSLRSAEVHVGVGVAAEDDELEVHWRVAESERMLALCYVMQAEREVNVRERRAQLSHAVTNAYASQASLQKWQVKGGTPKRALTAVPGSLLVMCRALLLLGQPKKGALLLEPLIEDKPNSATIRPPMWKELLNPTEEPLTAEDIVLRVDVSSVKIAVYRLYAQCLSKFDGERALRAVEQVHALLEDTSKWVRVVHGEVRGCEVAAREDQQQVPPAQLFLPSISQPASVASRSTVLVPPIIVTNTAAAEGLADSNPSYHELGNQTAAPRTTVVPEANPALTSYRTDDAPLSSTCTTNGEDTRSLLRLVSPSPVLNTAEGQEKRTNYGESSVNDDDDDCDHAVPPLISCDVPELYVHLESKSERLTAMRALRQGHSDLRKAFRDLEVISGDSLSRLQLFEDALESYCNAHGICVNEEQAVAAMAEEHNQRGSRGCSTTNSPQRSQGTLPKVIEHSAAYVKGTHPLLPLEHDFLDDEEMAVGDGVMVDSEGINSATAKNLHAVLINEERLDYKECEHLVLSKLATVYSALGEPMTAIHYNKLVLEYAAKNGNTLLEYKSMLKLARLYTSTNSHEEAQAMWEQVSELARQYEDMEVSRETTRNIVTVQEASGMYLDVITTAKELDRLASGVEGSEAAEDKRYALEALANAHLQLAQYTECLTTLDAREQVQEKSGEWTGKLLHMRARARLGNGEIAEAIRVLTRWSSKAAHIKSYRELGKANVALAQAYASDGSVFKARRCYQLALKSFSIVPVLLPVDKEALLDSARWLVHCYFLNKEEVQVDSNIKERAPNEGRCSGSHSGEDAEGSFAFFRGAHGGGTNFANQLHNNSGNLGVILAEDERMRAGTLDETADDDVENFLDDAMRSNPTPHAASHESESAITSSSTGAEGIAPEELSNDSDLDEEVFCRQVDSEIVCSSPARDGTAAASTTVDQKAAPSGHNAPAATAPSPAVPSTTSSAGTGKSTASSVPAPTSIANVSICSRPAAAASGTDVLDPVAPARTGTGPTPTATATTTTTSTTTTTRAPGTMKSGTTGSVATGVGVLGSHEGAMGNGVATLDGSSNLVNEDTEEAYETPAKVLTLCYRSAMETVEEVAQLLSLGSVVLRQHIPFSPAEAVDFALLAHPRTTFVFFFAEYATTSSSSYDVVIKPANVPFCIYRAAQVTTLKSYYELDATPTAPLARDSSQTPYSSTSPDAKADGGANMAALPASHPFAAAHASPDSSTPSCSGHVQLSASDARLRERLYDLYDELWSSVDSGLARARSDLSTAEGVVVVADVTLLHVPFGAMLPNPEGLVLEGCEDPLGSRASLVVTPAVTHFVRYTVNQDSAGHGRRSHCAPLHHQGRSKNVIFLPHSLRSPSSNDTAHSDRAGAPGSRRASAVSPVSSQFYPGVAALGYSGSCGPRESAACRRTSTILTMPLLETAPLLEMGGPMDDSWIVRYGCTRKELIQTFNDPNTSAAMLLCAAEGNQLKVADGMVSFCDLAGGVVHTRGSFYGANAAGSGNAHMQLNGALLHQRGNLHLVTITNDRSTPSNALEPGMCAKMCMQLGCRRVLRMDLPPGSLMSMEHKEFIILFLQELQRVERWGMSFTYATALRQAIAAAIKRGLPVSVWGSFTLVGAP